MTMTAPPRVALMEVRCGWPAKDKPGFCNQLLGKRTPVMLGVVEFKCTRCGKVTEIGIANA